MTERVSYARIDGLDAHDDATVGQLAEIERLAFGNGAWSPALLREEITQPGRFYVAATVKNSLGEEKILGYGGVFLGDVAEIMTVGVRPENQGEGIGRQLMNALIKAAREAALGRVLLEVRVDNAPAIALYESLGFTRISIRKRYYQPDDVDALVMELRLPR